MRLSGCLVWLGPDLLERERESRAVSVSSGESVSWAVLGPDTTDNTGNTERAVWLLSALLDRFW